MDVEKAFIIAGSFGQWQIFLLGLFCLSNMYGAWSMILQVFVAAMPGENLTMTTIVSEWNLTGDRAYIVSMVQSLFMFGVLIGNVTFGQLSDKLGRKPVFFTVLFLHFLLSTAGSFSTGYKMFGAIRFFVGVCQGGMGLVSFVLQQELLGSKIWPISGYVTSIMFSIGIMQLAGIAACVPNWQTLCILTSFPGILLCYSYFVMPESPRWLYSQGRIFEAEQVMKEIARKNSVCSSAVDSIILKKKESETSSPNKSYSIIDLFSTSEMAKRTSIMAYTWFVCSFTYYGLTMAASDLGKNLHVSVTLSGLVELPSAISIYFLAKPWSGRRRTLAASFIAGGVACTSIMFLSDTKDKTLARTILALIGKLCITAAFNNIYIFASELYPTVIRNVGMGSSSMCSRVGGILAPMVPILANVFPSLPYVTYGFASLIAGLISLQLVETLNQPIPDTIEDISYSKIPRVKQSSSKAKEVKVRR